jgi:hypothetical protein
MTGGAQRASSLRPRCVGEVDPETATHIYLSNLSIYLWWRIEGYTEIWCENLRERDHLEDQGVDGWIILRLIFRKWDMGHGFDRVGSGEGQLSGTCKCGNEHSVSIKCGEFLD